jgi:hypothetical protein
MKAHMDREKAAERYRPNTIDTLLVAEAPPAASDRYFYFETVTSHDHLFRHVCKVVLGKAPDRAHKAAALQELKARGIFLIDLKPDPVDGSDLRLYVPDLVKRCKGLKPRRIILIKATVYEAAYDALLSAGLPVVDERVYFPSSGRQAEFEVQFARALRAAPAG